MSDAAKIGALGLSQASVNETLSAAWGGIYVNDFVDRGRVKRVFVQGDAPYRSRPEDLGNWFVRTSTGTMAPFSSFATTHWGQAPSTLMRFNGLPAYEFQGQAAEGKSSGDAMERMAALAAKEPGVSVEWSGLSYQERLSGGQAPYLYAISLLVVFLCLAALYESWSVPFSVLLVIPLGLLGAALAVAIRGLPNDVYFQVGLLTTMGLSAKNAILIVEFAEQQERQGQDPLRRRAGSGAAQASADPDDQPRLHLRRAAARHLDRRRRQEPHRHRHRGDRRHADRDDPRHLLRSALLRAGAHPVPARQRPWRPGAWRRARDGGRGMRRAALPLLLSVALAGCSFEPHYQRPAPPIPPGWPLGDSYLAQSEASLPSVSYRDIFRDPKLQAIIEEALANNRNLRIAAANIASTLAQYHIQRASLFPQVGAEATAGVTGAHEPTTTIISTGTGGTGTGTGGSGTGTGGTAPGIALITTPGSFTTSQSYSASVGVTSWELDLFGRVRSLSHSALDQYFATEAAARATRLTMVGQIATAYFQLAADNSLLNVAKDTAANAQHAVTLTNERLVGGVSSRIDLREAQTILDQAKSDVATQTTLVAQDRNALQLLVGAPIADNLIPASIESVDGLVSELPAGLSSTILLRRPDVVEAEYQLRAANARIGAARAAFFPTISLTGLLGLASNTLTGLFTGSAFNFHAGGSASVPIFDGGANRGNLALRARATANCSSPQYEQTIQTAFREVSDALARRGTIEAQVAAQNDLVAHSLDAYNLEQERYRIGIDEFLNTLVAQRTLYTSQQSLIRTRLARATNLSDLYQTLGGDALIEAGAGQNQAPTPLTLRAGRLSDALILQLDPGRRVVGGFLAAAILLVDTGIEQPVGRLRAQQQMVDAKAGVALPAAGGIVPKGVDGAFRVAGADRVGPALVEDGPEGGAAFRLHQRVVGHRPSREDIVRVVARDHVPVARQHRRLLLGEQLQRVGAEAIHPGKLVGEFLGADRIAVRKIERADHHPVQHRLDIAAVGVVGITGEAGAAQLQRPPLRRQDSDSVEALLPVPVAVIAGGAHLGDREAVVGTFDLLEADQVRLLLLQIFDQPRQPRTNAVEIVGDDLHRRRLSPARRMRLDAEARPAAAAGLGVGVADLKAGAAEIVDEIDRAALHQIVGHRIDDEGDSVLLGDEIIRLRLIGKAEAIAEAGAAAAFDREPQDRLLALPLRDPRDASRRRRGQCDVGGFAHAREIGWCRHSGKLKRFSPWCGSRR